MFIVTMLGVKAFYIKILAMIIFRCKSVYIVRHVLKEAAVFIFFSDGLFVTWKFTSDLFTALSYKCKAIARASIWWSYREFALFSAILIYFEIFWLGLLLAAIDLLLRALAKEVLVCPLISFFICILSSKCFVNFFESAFL